MIISIYTILIWSVAILIGSLGLVIYIGSKKLSSRAFVFSMFWVSLWIIGVGLLSSTENQNISLILCKINYYLGSIIASSFLYFFLTYPDDKKPNKFIGYFLILLQTLFLPLFIFTDKIIKSSQPLNSISHWWWSFGQYSYLFDISFLGFFTLGTVILYKKYKNNADLYKRKNLLYMLLTIIIGSIPPSIMCIILPRLGYFNLNWLGPITEIIWIPIMSYSIIKYRQMDVRTVITEAIALGMTIIFFVNIFVDFSFSFFIRVSIFSIFIILFICLLKISVQEAKQRDQLNKLNAHLEQRVAEQTMEVKKAFELEKHARREVEKLNETKDQFIMITQHNLRTPVTSIKWESEALLNGDRGGMSPEVEQSVKNINISSKRLVRIVDDFLNITALKIGSHILTKTRGNLKELFEEVINELKIDLNNMNIVIKYPSQDDYWPILDFDKSKMHEVILIIIENAVRYNRKDGNIEITNKIESTNNSKTETEEKILKINIKNTGVGISKEDRTNLFTRLFYRSKKAQATHPIGMGIGLSVARAVVRAHNGDITIESEGENMGATVILTLPIQDK